MKKDRVLVTGFGPFGAHSINASWEAVRQLPEMLDVKTLGIELVIELLPVDYEETLLGLCELWEKHRPLLIINVGVSGSATELTLESCAFKHGYHRPDVEGKTPEQEECCVGKEDQLFTNLDVDKLASDLNKLQTKVRCCTSHDAGRFLCEFSYCVSLSLNDRNSLFVHVPDIGNPYSSKVTAQGLCEIISLAVLQLKDLSTTNKVASNKI